MQVPARTMSSREFNQNTGEAKKAAERGPVTITDRGRPSFVLLRYEDYCALLDRTPSLAEAFAGPPGVADVELPLPARTELGRAAVCD
jgi:prevent-host-death family protein